MKKISILVIQLLSLPLYSWALKTQSNHNYLYREATMMFAEVSGIIDQEDYWDAQNKDKKMEDEFGNKYSQSSNGDFVYQDEQGVEWYHNKKDGIWIGNDTVTKDSWQYMDDGDINYWSADGDWWHHYPSGTETYVKGGQGSFTITITLQEQLFYDCVKEKCSQAQHCISQWEQVSKPVKDIQDLHCDNYDLYYYYPNGDELFLSADLQLGWNWDEYKSQFEFMNNNTALISTSGPIYFGGYDARGYVSEQTGYPDGPYLEYSAHYDHSLGTWSFTDASGRSVWYYEQFVWGNEEETWYLRYDYHDDFAEGVGFWP